MTKITDEDIAEALLLQRFTDNGEPQEEKNTPVRGVSWSEAALAHAITLADMPAPAGEPAGWQRRWLYPKNGEVPQWGQCSEKEATGHFEKVAGYEYRPLYAAPQPTLTHIRADALREAANTCLRLSDDRFRYEFGTALACHNSILALIGDEK